MRIRSLVAASLTSLTVLVLLACSSSTKDPTPATAQDAATGTDASTDASIAPARPQDGVHDPIRTRLCRAPHAHSLHCFTASLPFPPIHPKCVWWKLSPNLRP